MKIKTNYVAIALLTILVALVGSVMTTQGLVWYNGLQLPSIAPAGSFIGSVWTVIYILGAIAAAKFLDAPRGKDFKSIKALFLLNAFLNVLWSFVFFTLHLFWWAIVEMLILNLTIVALIFLLWHYRRTSALLLLPYFLWVSFATYLAYLVASLNA